MSAITSQWTQIRSNKTFLSPAVQTEGSVHLKQALCLARPAGFHHSHWAPPSDKWLETSRRLRSPPAEHRRCGVCAKRLHKTILTSDVSGTGSCGWIMKELIYTRPLLCFWTSTPRCVLRGKTHGEDICSKLLSLRIQGESDSEYHWRCLHSETFKMQIY